MPLRLRNLQKRSRLDVFDVMFLIKMFHFKLDWRVRPRSLWYSTRSNGVPSILRTGGGSCAWEKFITSSLHLLRPCHTVQFFLQVATQFYS